MTATEPEYDPIGPLVECTYCGEEYPADCYEECPYCPEEEEPPL